MTTGASHHGFELPPKLEERRLHSLEQLSVFGTPPEERFARLTRLARKVFGVPMAAIALVDEDTMWFKQADGLDQLGPHLPRGHTLLQALVVRGYENSHQPLVLEDIAAEPDFRDLPFIKAAGGLRFYAGFPLYGPGGHPVGSFAIYDIKPHHLGAEELEAFSELAGWAQRELEQVDEMARAAEVQRHLMPRPLGELPGYSVGALCVPAFAVGGDFYDHYRVSGGVVFTVADVMGKGLGAALLAASVRSTLRGATRAFDRSGLHADLADAFNDVAGELADDFEDTNSFVTLFHMRLDTDSGAVSYIDAGHSFAVVVRSTGGVERLLSDGLPIGVLPNEHWNSRDIALNPGDSMLVTSDGVLDLLGAGGDLGPALEFAARNFSPDEVCKRARAQAAANPPLDDVTVLAIRRESPS